jgi:threonine/homoserine/homoserine lactone efflux protein
MEYTLLPLIGFAIAATITPGPNNVMVTTSAVNHGLRATLPHICGIAAGFAIMLVLVCAGLAGVLLQSPLVATALHFVSLAWLLWLAWQIATAAPLGSVGARPALGFFGAMAFQWVNPKAWMICLGAAGAFMTPDGDVIVQALTVGLVFLAVALPCIMPWALLGAAAARLLLDPARLRAFNIAMAILLVLSMLPIAFS